MSLPKHVAIIMDGNGRWAKARRHNRFYGHLRGAKIAKDVISQASDLGVENLTLFTFSTENWFRPAEEVSFLMKLLIRQLKREQKRLVEQNIRFHTIGEVERLPMNVRKAIAETKELTENCDGMKLTFALSFGGRQELKWAFQKLAERVALGEVRPDEIGEAEISKALESAFLPDPDLIIRTSGEHRLSNFFLWSAAYSELYLCEKYWPEFSAQDFQSALDFYSSRKRRYGRVQNKMTDEAECRPYQ